MLNWLNGRSADRHKAGELYGKVVAAARQPAFYGPGRVADTPEGRFEMIAVHLFLAVERVIDLQPEGEDIARHMIEAFVVDMDDCMREMGVGDLTVPKRVKRAAAGFYERSGAYRAGLAEASNDELAAALGQYLHPDQTSGGQAQSMASYMRASSEALAKLSSEELNAGQFNFVPPVNLFETQP